MLMEYDMIEPSKSPWACGVVMAKKKGGQLRFCCDFRYLNAVTIKDAYPIPRIDEKPIQAGRREVLHDVGFGLCVLTSATQKARSRENRLRV